MDRVTTFSTYSSILSNLMRAEGRQTEAQNQFSTGKRASDMKGFGGDSQSLTAAVSLKTRVDGYVNGAKALQNRLDTQALAFAQIGDAAQGARDAVGKAIANGRADGLMSALETLFGQAVQGLNTQNNGAYVFAGGQSNTAPMAARSLSDLTAAPSTASLFSNDDLAPTQKIDDSTTMKTGFLADEIGGPLVEIFRQIQAFAEGPDGPLEGQLTQPQIDFLTNLLPTMDAATTGITGATAENGLLQSRAEATRNVQEDRQDMLEGLIGTVSGVDAAEAVSRLIQAQNAVQASAQVFATLKDSSLLNLLR
jgi:flagellar hook-associated protein 3 FlgL